MSDKPFWKSWTIRINLLAILVMGVVGYNFGLEPQIEISILGVVNIVLRFVTRTPII